MIPNTTINTRTKPRRWPNEVQYVGAQQYHKSVTPQVVAFIVGRKQSSTCTPPSPLANVQLVSDEAHPAFGQRGLFASKKIAPRTHIVDYFGEVHCEERPESNYDLSLHRSSDGKTHVGIDSSRMGNEARFINDYRGIKSGPNAEFREYRSDNGVGELRMGIWSCNGAIKKGDEILVSYGKSWWKARAPSSTETDDQTADIAGKDPNIDEL